MWPLFKGQQLYHWINVPLPGALHWSCIAVSAPGLLQLQLSPQSTTTHWHCGECGATALRCCLRGTMGLEMAKHLQTLGVWICWKSDAVNSAWSLTNGEKMVFSKHCKSFAFFIGSTVGILTDWSPKIPPTEAASLSFVSSRSLG